MKLPPKQEVHYGALVWCNPTLEAIRREECMCWSCDKLIPGSPQNCPVAQQLYEMCVKENVATPVSRCPKWKNKGE